MKHDPLETFISLLTGLKLDGHLCLPGKNIVKIKRNYRNTLYTNLFEFIDLQAQALENSPREDDGSMTLARNPLSNCT